MFSQWANDQWTAFIALSVAGVATVLLVSLAVRAARAMGPAPASAYTGRHVAPRPTLALAARRITPHELEDLTARFRAADAAGMTTTLAPAVDPTGEIAAHLAEGPGSLTSLAATGPGVLERVELVDPDVASWFTEAFDRVLDEFHVAIEPAMRKARLWEIQGRGVNGHTCARTALDEWRIDTPTGEWPVVVPVGERLPAAFVSA